MRRYRRGQSVVLKTALKRNRRHKYGPVRLRRGAPGRVQRRHQKLLRSPRYDVQFRGRRGQTRSVRKVPAVALRRPRPPLAVILLVLAVVLVIGYLTGHG